MPRRFLIYLFDTRRSIIGVSLPQKHSKPRKSYNSSKTAIFYVLHNFLHKKMLQKAVFRPKNRFRRRYPCLNRHLSVLASKSLAFAFLNEIFCKIYCVFCTIADGEKRSENSLVAQKSLDKRKKVCYTIVTGGLPQMCCQDIKMI